MRNYFLCVAVLAFMCACKELKQINQAVAKTPTGEMLLLLFESKAKLVFEGAKINSDGSVSVDVPNEYLLKLLGNRLGKMLTKRGEISIKTEGGSIFLKWKPSRIRGKTYIFAQRI